LKRKNEEGEAREHSTKLLEGRTGLETCEKGVLHHRGAVPIDDAFDVRHR
jgi:hypothetical protein